MLDPQAEFFLTATARLIKISAAKPVSLIIFKPRLSTSLNLIKIRRLNQLSRNFISFWNLHVYIYGNRTN